MEWPPSAPQFRGMCLGVVADDEGNDVAWQQRNQSRSVHEALGYEPKALPDITTRERHRAEQKAKLAKLRAETGI